MCFLTYICNYLFLFHTLFYYKKRRLCLPFDGSFALSSLWKRVNTWSSFADLYVVLLYKAFCQTVVRTALPRHDLCTICYPILLLAKQYYRMKTVRVILCQYYQGNIHIHFLFRHICQKRILQPHHQFHGLALFQYIAPDKDWRQLGIYPPLFGLIGYFKI